MTVVRFRHLGTMGEKIGKVDTVPTDRGSKVEMFGSMKIRNIRNPFLNRIITSYTIWIMVGH